MTEQDVTDQSGQTGSTGQAGRSTKPPQPLAPQPEAPDRNLALELVRVTEAAAMAAGRWVGRGDKNGADGAAVNAMRQLIHTVSMSGVVVIGEGEKDEAPMLFNGEHVGDGRGPECDVAVDPVCPDWSVTSCSVTSSTPRPRRQPSRDRRPAGLRRMTDRSCGCSGHFLAADADTIPL